MFEFKKEIINGSFNKINKASKNTDSININIRSNDKNIDIKCMGKGIWAASIITTMPTIVCVMGVAASVYGIAKIISVKRKNKEEEECLTK